jgi:ComF family protein
MCGRLAFEGLTHPMCRTRYCLDGLTSFFHYDGITRKAIKAIKYRLVFDAAEEFVGLISVPDFKNYILIPIPLHPNRFRSRGFNQAEVLGSILSKRLNIPIRTDILRRVKETEPQASIAKRTDRLENMKNIFGCKKVSGNILLFDDVFTTGATMRSAAAALKRAGAARVWAVSMAR